MAANRNSVMLPLQLLLNPDSPGPTIPISEQSTGFIYSPTMSIVNEDSLAINGSPITRAKRSKESSYLSKSGPRGPINFPPFEDLDDVSLREVSRFQVTPFGQIHQVFEHFPYNSEKRDLLEKTGRESIEAFTYEFRVPGNNSVYVVMWDYNIGIVRLASLFRLCGFNKTGPAQTFSKNPGLLDITPNITGGAVPAQGYWFPYRCARAICAKFCHQIAGALIPIFGPGFPAECTPPESPRYRRLDINEHILAQAAQESEVFRRIYMNRAIKAGEAATSHPRTERLSYVRRGNEGEQRKGFREEADLSSRGADDHMESSRAFSVVSPSIRERRVKTSTPVDLCAVERRPLRHAKHYSDNIPQADLQYEVPGKGGQKRRKVGIEEKGQSAAFDIDAIGRGPERTTSRNEQQTSSEFDQYSAAMILVNLRLGLPWAGNMHRPVDPRDKCSPSFSGHG